MKRSISLLFPLFHFPISSWSAPASQIFPRDDPPPVSNGIDPKIWAPVLAFVLFAILIASYKWLKTSNKINLSGMGNGVALASGATLPGGSSVRVVTADQLAGGNPRTRTSRPRRARRTPSQISTMSLPEYMKEPGDQEVVIFRGISDMEDGAMPPLHEDETDDSSHSRNSSGVSVYPPMVQSPNDEPLLQNHDQENDSHTREISDQTLLSPPGDSMPRRSIETLASAEDSDVLSRVNSNVSPEDPRGEAPAYYEDVNLDDIPNSNTTRNPPPEVEVTSEPTPAAEAPRRRSGFRTLFDAFRSTSTNPQTSHPPSAHARNASAFSTTSHSHEGTSSLSSHRPSTSMSTTSSFLHSSSSAFRNLGRPRSPPNGMTSTSTLSLHVISAPLSHTLVRTEFTYPKTGPTPEQLAVISSRESFARFGVPYGAEAIAFAASTSRQELPPPDFEAASSTLNLSQNSGSSPRAESPLAERNRSSSRASRHERSTSSGTLWDSSLVTTTSPPSSPNLTPGPSSAPRIPSLGAYSTSLAHPPSPTPASKPPSAFRHSSDNSVARARASSRASSIVSYATAQEMDPGESGNDDDGSSPRPDNGPTPSSPLTPRQGPQHILEGTDVTIMPGTF